MLEPRPRRDPASGGAARPPVLVVEDDPSVRQVVEWALEDAGIAAQAVSDGERAVAWLARHRPALVVLDLGLPIVDGFGVADALRSLHGTSVPVIVMTAGASAAEGARRIGACDFLSKPFDVDDLIEAIRGALRG